MNIDGIMRMFMRMFMRKGMRQLSKSLGGNKDSRLKNAKRAMKITRRAGRM